MPSRFRTTPARTPTRVEPKADRTPCTYPRIYDVVYTRAIIVLFGALRRAAGTSIAASRGRGRAWATTVTSRARFRRHGRGCRHRFRVRPLSSSPTRRRPRRLPTLARVRPARPPPAPAGRHFRPRSRDRSNPSRPVDTAICSPNRARAGRPRRPRSTTCDDTPVEKYVSCATARVARRTHS